MAGQQQSGPKTAFGRFMVYKFIPQYANNVQGLVYMGAAILIIIIGLRGLGAAAYGIPIVPKFLFDEAHKVSVNYVMFALFLEFGLLLTLALVTFFTPEDDGSGGHAEEKAPPTDGELQRIKAQLSELKNIAEADVKALNSYIDGLGEVNKRLTAVKQDFFKSLSELKQVFK